MDVIDPTNDPAHVVTVKPALNPSVPAFRPMATPVNMSSAAVINLELEDETVPAFRPLATSMSMSSAAANSLEGLGTWLRRFLLGRLVLLCLM